ncbi:MAG: hypothetical protein ACRC2M_12260 [Planktothrix sp.]
MRVENQKIEGWLGDAAKNEIFLNGELEARDMAIATLQTELDKNKAIVEGVYMAFTILENELNDTVAGFNRVAAELDRATAEIKEKELAIAILKAELEAGDIPLFTPEPTQPPELIPTSNPITELITGNLVIDSDPEPFNPDSTQPQPPEPEPEPTPEPEPESVKSDSTTEPESKSTKTDTVDRSGLLEFINKNFPDSKIDGKKITNAVYRGGEFLSKLESEYGFKFVGKIKDVNRFQLLSKL